MQVDVLVIGGGPAGLMAAEAASGAGARVLVAEKMPSLGRKFLMAGKSGLNLTKEEPEAAFRAAFGSAEWLRPMLDRFGPVQARAWAEGLGQEMFTGSTGRVFPVVMKGSPLLRAWLHRLDGSGVMFRTRWRWCDWAAGGAVFETPEGPVTVTAKAIVLALGGASWPRLGSGGDWTGLVGPVAPFRPANCGFRVAWSAHMAPHFGSPVKAVELQAGTLRTRGEFVLSRSGIEGGAIYTLAHALRDRVPLVVDLLPDHTLASVSAKLAAGKRGDSLSNRLRKAVRLDAVKRALLMECGRPLADDPQALARQLKSLPVPVGEPFPIETAISVAGGLRAEALDDALMLKERPGVFAAGEMLDWEAPTGGYLLTASMATGLWAGEHSAAYGLRG